MTRSDGAFVLGIVFTLAALWFAASKDWIVVAPANSLPCEIKPPGTEAYRVGTLVLSRARRIASSNEIIPPGGGGKTLRTDLSLSTTTLLMSESMSGRAMDDGTGVTSPTQMLEILGVKRGTLIMMRRRKPVDPDRRSEMRPTPSRS